MLRSITSIIFLFLAITAPIPIFADESPIISSVVPSGATSDDEYIDIFNPSGAEIPLQGWSIQYRGAAGSTYTKKNFPSDATIPGSGTYRIAGKGYTGAVVANMTQSTISLASSGGNVYLVNAQTTLTSDVDPSIVDHFVYGTAAGGDDSTTPPPTPPPPAPSPTKEPAQSKPTPYEDMPPIRVTIRAYETDPLPGEMEWVELYNDSSYAIELEGWSIIDGSSKKVASPIGLLLPKTAQKVYLPSVRLNNTGDRIGLLDSNGVEVFALTYGSWLDDTYLPPTEEHGQKNMLEEIVKGAVEKAMRTFVGEFFTPVQIDSVSVEIRTNEGTVSTQTNNETKITPAPPAKPKSIAQKTTTSKTIKTVTPAKPKIEGVIIAAEGEYWADYAVLKSETESYQFHLPPSSTLKLAVGDTLRASGSWSTAKEQPLKRFLVKKDADVAMLEQTETPEPIEISLSNLSEHVGSVVTVSGVVDGRTANTIRIKDKDAIAEASAKSVSAISGDGITITGLVVTSGDGSAKIITSDPEQVVITPSNPQKLRPAKQNYLQYIIALVPASILLLLVFIGKRMKKKGGETDGSS